MSPREWSMVRRVIRDADLILEVLDARDPYATRCAKLEQLVRKMGKRLVLVINKADLVPKHVLDSWKKVLSREYPTVYISAKDRLGTRRLWRIIKMNAPRLPVKVAVVGYPNVGKSMIINVLKGRHSTGTSPIPGFTRADLKVRAATWLIVIDTPGVVPPGEDEEELVIKGALRPEALEDPLNPAIKLVELALSRDPRAIERTYGIAEREPYKILQELARRRGFLLKGGELNVDEAARVIIRDWQQGRLVFYSLPKHYDLI